MLQTFVPISNALTITENNKAQIGMVSTMTYRDEPLILPVVVIIV
jgi:hypothetical protein